MGNQTDRAKEVFLDAIDIDAPDERRTFLDQACGDDGSLRGEVEALLEYHRRIGSFLAQAPQDPIATASHIAIADDGPGTVIGLYRLMEQIGEGGFGLVFVAEQQQPIRRRLALKVIKPGMDTREVVARFEAERQALALMDHPNIARVFDGGATPSGRPFFVMELVKGVPITQYCDDHRLNPRDRLRLFADLCSAVQHAHQKGVIHRDLKPTNVLVTSHDGNPVVKVIDFGVAKAVGQSLTDKTVYTGFAQMVGTPLYMSPEQAGSSGLDVDTRSDIYSLGVLLYELLSGTTPFDKERLRELGYDEIRRILREEEPAKPSTRITTLGQAASTVSANRGTDPHNLRRMIRGELDWIVMKALEKDRNRRYESASVFAADINRYLNDEPVQACPPSMRYRLRKFLRRNRGPVLVGGAIFLGSLGGLVGAAYGSIESAKKREVAGLYEDAVRARDGEAKAKRDAEDARERLAVEEYGRTIQVAYQECRENNVPAALALLDRTRPELRGWEWRYVYRLCHSELLTVDLVRPDGKLGTIVSTAFSPDGTRVVVGGRGNTVVLDANTGATLLVLEGHTQGLRCARFNSEGTRIVTGWLDGTARVWDALTGAELLTFKGNDKAIRSVWFSPDGERVLIAGDDKCARVWDAKTGKELVTCAGHKELINAAAFNHDGTRIVTASQDETAIIWDAKTGARLQTLTGHTNSLSSVAFSPDSSLVVTGSYDRTARVWDAVKGKQLQTFHGHADIVMATSFSPDGSRIVSGGWDLTARVWDAKSGMELLTLIGHTFLVTAASFSPDGSRIVTGTQAEIKIWDAGRKAGGLTFREHTYCVHSAAVSPDGLRVVSMGLDKAANLEKTPERMLVWDARTGVVTATYMGGGRSFKAAAFSPDGVHIVTACRDGTARVWDSRTGMEVLNLRGHKHIITSATFNRDGTRIVTGSYDKTARVWDAKTGAELLAFRGHTDAVRSVAFSPDGSRIASAGDTTARLWDAKSGVEIAAITQPLGVWSAAFSPDGTRVVTAGDDGTARVWDARTLTEVLTLNGHTSQLRTVSFSRDGTRIVTGGLDRTVRLWDAKTGAEVLTLKGHTHEIDSAEFSPDGTRIVSAGFSAVQVWDPSPPPKPQGKVLGPTN